MNKLPTNKKEFTELQVQAKVIQNSIKEVEKIVRAKLEKEFPAVHFAVVEFALCGQENYRVTTHVNGNVIVRFSVGPNQPHFMRVIQDICNAIIMAEYPKMLKKLSDENLEILGSSLVHRIIGNGPLAIQKMELLIKESVRRSTNKQQEK